jgi:hypothetical protein
LKPLYGVHDKRLAFEKLQAFVLTAHPGPLAASQNQSRHAD